MNKRKPSEASTYLETGTGKNLNEKVELQKASATIDPGKIEIDRM